MSQEICLCHKKTNPNKKINFLSQEFYFCKMNKTCTIVINSQLQKSMTFQEKKIPSTTRDLGNGQ